MQLNKVADRHFRQAFKNAFYIGRAQIYSEDYDRRPHKFFYIGYQDLFGVIMPEGKGRSGYQVWGTNWVYGRSKLLDKALREAMKGNFPDVRHNVRVRARAKSHGKRFIKPKWAGEKTILAEEENQALPIRGRKRRRRKLLV